MLPLSLGLLACISLGLTLWQWIVARRFPLHERAADGTFSPAVTLLKPLKGADAETAACLRSWLAQEYAGPVQVLFGVASAEDPAGAVARQLLAQYPEADAQLVVCPESLGPNSKVATLVQLERLAKHEFLIISDADVHVPTDLVANVVPPLRDPAVGLVNPFYRLANPVTAAMRWEALATNADFWSSVLQAASLKPLAFALGAVMALPRARLTEIGGFRSLVHYLADDYELGARIARKGARIALCPVVVECREAPQGWGAVWRHQLRWARTIRVCQPLPYALSILSNATLWPLAWWLAQRDWGSLAAFMVCLGVRLATAADNQRRLTKSTDHLPWMWLAPVKDLLQVALWALAFLGRRVEWRGQRFRVLPSGRLELPAEG